MKTLLIVDDHPDLRELVEVTLQVVGLRIIHAENGNQAIEVALKEKPELIIMDVMMPGDIDGYEATKIIKNDPRMKKSKVIMLTSKGQKADKKKGFEAGAIDYFVKPFSPLDLIKKVEEVLDQD